MSGISDSLVDTTHTTSALQIACHAFLSTPLSRATTQQYWQTNYVIPDSIFELGKGSS